MQYSAVHMLSEIVDMETLADCPVTDVEVNLKQNFFCVWYCRNRSVTTVRQSECPTVIRPRGSLVQLLKNVKCTIARLKCAHRLAIARGVLEVRL